MALERSSPRAISPSHPAVAIISARAGWRPTTLVRRIRAALPASIEQELYLKVAESVRINPESLAKILRCLLGTKELQPSDMIDRRPGPNLVTNRFVEVANLVAEVLAITHVFPEYYGTRIAVTTAATIARAYGPDHVEVVADSMLEYLAGCGFSEQPQRMAMAIGWFARDGLPMCESRGTAFPNDIGAWLEEDPDARRSLHSYIGWPKGRQR